MDTWVGIGFMRTLVSKTDKGSCSSDRVYEDIGVLDRWWTLR
jgi:hypothetical protein